MNTSDGAPTGGDLAGLPAGLPDLEALARMASQYFGTLGDLQVDGYPMSMEAPPPSLVPDASVPGTVNPGASVPAMPGDLSGLKVPAASPIYFLEEARTAFAEGANREALSEAGQVRFLAPPAAPDLAGS